jgi:hypothetical protein
MGNEISEFFGCELLPARVVGGGPGFFGGVQVYLGSDVG